MNQRSNTSGDNTSLCADDSDPGSARAQGSIGVDSIGVDIDTWRKGLGSINFRRKATGGEAIQTLRLPADESLKIRIATTVPNLNSSQPINLEDHHRAYLYREDGRTNPLIQHIFSTFDDLEINRAVLHETPSEYCFTPQKPNGDRLPIQTLKKDSRYDYSVLHDALSVYYVSQGNTSFPLRENEFPELYRDVDNCFHMLEQLQGTQSPHSEEPSTMLTYGQGTHGLTRNQSRP